MHTVRGIDLYLPSPPILGRLRNICHRVIWVSPNFMLANSVTRNASMAYLIGDIAFSRGCVR
jgi:hypothetical protein